MDPDFTTVTEVPGINITQNELSHIYTRYQWASQYVSNKTVLEVACGSGQGLGYLVKHGAKNIVGSDIEEQNLAHAKTTYKENSQISLAAGDATSLHYEDASFNIVVNFEAIYYIEHPQQAFIEAYRLLSSQGKFLISTVNCEWHGFNPSPYSHNYPTAKELRSLMYDAGFTSIKIYAGFYDEPASGIRGLVSFIRTRAAKFGLIPKTMKGKELLKRLFYGELIPMPKVLKDEYHSTEALIPIEEISSLDHYTFLYAIGDKP